MNLAERVRQRHPLREETDSYGITHRVSSPALSASGTTYEVRDQDQTARMIEVLARQIEPDKDQYDFIVMIKRGGALVGSEVARILNMPAYAIRTKLYTGIHEAAEARENNLEILEPLPADLVVAGKRILLIDDVNHTSVTLAGATAYLKSLGAAAVASAVLDQKPGFCSMQADYWVRQTDAWIAYYWEHQGSQMHPYGEFFELKIKEMQAAGVSCIAIVKWLRHIGFSRDDLKGTLSPDFQSRL